MNSALLIAIALSLCSQVSSQMAEIIPQSSLRMIARPDLYDKKTVRVVGVIGHDIGDGFCLYVDKDSETSGSG
jgi:hypothetical protein